MVQPGQETTSARSDAPHNIFQPQTARSSDDDDAEAEAKMLEDYDSLSQSINKLHNLQTQLSGVNRESGLGSGDAAAAVNTYRSASTIQSSQGASRLGSIDDFIQGIMDNSPAPKTTHWASARIDPNSPPVTDRSSATLKEENGPMSPVANNMSNKGKNLKVKTSLSSMENSYQNIKHKTPINQVNSVSGSQRTASVNKSRNADKMGGSDRLLEHKVLEDCVNKLNSSAVVIQRWFRRHRRRKQVGAAAMRRLMAQKKEVSLSGSQLTI